MFLLLFYSDRNLFIFSAYSTCPISMAIYFVNLCPVKLSCYTIWWHDNKLIPPKRLKCVARLILLSEWCETLKEAISSTSCGARQRYLPVYTTPLSSTDMLMLLVPLVEVVRFRAESCLLSTWKTATISDITFTNLIAHLSSKTCLYYSVPVAMFSNMPPYCTCGVIQEQDVAVQFVLKRPL